MNHGWKHLKIEDCFEYIKNGANIKQSKEASGYPITRIETLSNGVFNRNKVGYANIFNLDKYENNVLCNGDLLMSHINSSKFLGRTVVYHAKNDEIFIHGMNLLRLIPNKILISDFFYYITLTHYFKSKISQIRKDAVNQSSFSISDLKKILIPIPLKEIQERIVCELDKLNELIELKRNQLKDLDALAQSLFYETFGDPLENSKKWNVRTLSEYANFKNGLNFTPADDGNKIKCLGVGDFKSNRYIKAENLPEINIVEAVSEEYLLKDGDIILVRSNGNKALIGRSIMYVSDNSLATFSGFCIRCRYNREKLAPLFLSYYLSCSAIREYITSQGRGCNISNLNQKILSGIPLILPPLSLQNEFAERIDAIEKQKRLIESLIADLETLLASRMDCWFND